jgi:hypothetical protein
MFYLHASSLPKGNFMLLKVLTPEVLIDDSRLSGAGTESLPLLEKNSATHTDADLSVEAGFSAYNGEEKRCRVPLLLRIRL